MSKRKKSSKNSAKKQLRRRARRLKSRNMGMESLEERMVLTSPFIQGIAVDDGSLLADIENTAPREITLRFDGSQVISASAGSLDGIVLTHGGPDRTLGTADDVTIEPGFSGIGDAPNEVILRFAENLPDNIYSIQVFGNGLTPLRNVDGDVFDADLDQPGVQDFEQIFRLDLGAQVTAVVPQPIDRAADGTLTQRLDQIVVYFNNDPLSQSSAENPGFYQLRFTGHTDEFDADFDTVNDLDDVVHLPTNVSYDAETNVAVLTFASNINELDNDLPGVDRADGTGTYRLQVGLNSATPLNNTPDNVLPTSDPGDQFSTAFDLGEVFSRGVEVIGAIDPRVAPLPYPGSNDEPGHRDIPIENHFINGDFASDLFPGATTIFYNFRDDYGFDPAGNPLQNLITDNQKDLAREIVEIYSFYTGIQFVESEELGFTIATGDIRALSPNAPTGPGGVLGIATGGNFLDGLAIMDAAEDWSDEFAIQDSADQFSWFETAMHEIGHILGLGHSFDLPGLTVQGSDFTQSVSFPEPIFPGDGDIIHIRHVHRPESNDVDLYRFEVSQPGVVSIETFAERLENSSLADTQITVWQEVDGEQIRIAGNDDYFSEDSFLELTIDAGTYFVGVSSTGNDEYNPNLANSGADGTSEGNYELRIHHRNELAADQQIQDRVESLYPDPRFTPDSSQPLDGDYDGTAGGAYNFWFRAATPERTHIVDKAGFGDFTEIDNALEAAQPGDIVRIVGNGGADGDVSTTLDNLPYEVGRSVFGNTLADGSNINVPRGVTLMVDAGTSIKFRNSSITQGSAAPGVDRSGSAIQILGTNDQFVHLTSFQDDSFGGDTDNLPALPRPGDWGGIVFANDIDAEAGRFDYEDQSIFLNYVNHADIEFAGGSVIIDSVSQVNAPIEMRDSRATVTFNRITEAAEAAIAATPDSFEETNFHSAEFQSVEFVSDYTRIGPDIFGNSITDNSFNGLFIRTVTLAGQELREQTVSGRWNDTDIPHIIAENLILRGQSGNAILDEDNVLQNPADGFLIARDDARLRVDPGTIVKLDGAVIEVGIGAQLIAEGSSGKEVVFTSVLDDTYGGSGTFDTSSNGFADDQVLPGPGDWGGIYFGFLSSGSIDHATIAYGGGTAPIEGSFTGYNAIAVHQAELRLTNSHLTDNAGGFGGQAPDSRFGRTSNEEAAIFVRQSQPILINNIIENTTSLSGGPAAAVSINVSSLNRDRITDLGRSTGLAEQFPNHVDNQGPLIDGNFIGGNGINGLLVRGATLTTESVFDDQDIVHVVLDEISVPNFHTHGGLRLESSSTESLVVKLQGANAGFTAGGRPLDIDDRIGGSIQIVGHPNFPVVLTSTGDNSVGAGRTPDGSPNFNVLGQGFTAQAGDWRSVQFGQYSNDRNVPTIIEFEPTDIDFAATDNPRNNGIVDNAQFLGRLAQDTRSGDENLRLGFDLHGTIAREIDVDTYSFQAQGGTEVFFDIDHTTATLDSVIELITADGFVLAASDSSHLEDNPFNHSDPGRPGFNARNLNASGFATTDHFSINPNDAGFRVVLPEGGLNTYHIRVRSNGLTAGSYELQVRMTEVDEIAGSSVEFADIRFATNGIELLGVPRHSPLLAEVGEINRANNEFLESQFVGNVLNSDRGAISVSGALEGPGDVDWYTFDVDYQATQGGSGHASITLDLDYADGFSGANTSFAVYSEDGRLVAYGDESNIVDDLSAPNQGADLDDLSRGSGGNGDPFIGPLSLPDGTYSVAVFPNSLIPREFGQYLDREELAAFPGEVNRALPNDAVARTAVDFGDAAGPLLFEPETLTLNEINTYITTDANIYTVNAFTGAQEYTFASFAPELIGDYAVRPEDGRFFTITDQGTRAEIDPATGALIPLADDGGEGITFFDAMTEVEMDDDGTTTTISFSESAATIEWEAFTFSDGFSSDPFGFTQDFFWAVGNRTDAGLNMGEPTPDYEDNILYSLDYFSLGTLPENLNPIRNSDDIVDPVADDEMPNEDGQAGAFSDYVERGRIDASGLVTGVAFLEDVLYAVDDLGGLYRIDDPFVFAPASNDNTAAPFGPGITTTFVGNVGTGGIEFSGLSLAPQELEDSAFEGLLVGIDTAGEIYAFDTDGNLQNIFADGESSVGTDLVGSNGIGFAGAQESLWHTSNARAGNAGHGVVTPVTEVSANFPQGVNALDTQEVPGGDAFYFGQEQRLVQNGRSFVDTTVNNYDLPGGARGSLNSQPFSLASADAADEPFLYFNYLLDTEGAQSTDSGTERHADSFRVFVQDDNGVSHLLATNNQLRDTGMSDEFDLSATNNDNYGRVQELFDNVDQTVDPANPPSPLDGNIWRQARIPLADFAGQENLTLSFNFSTEGGINNPNLPTFGFSLFDNAGDPNIRPTGVTDNAHEGAWIDDIVIGFAERGEVVTGTHRNDTMTPLPAPQFVENLAVPNQQIDEGTYQLEIRRSLEYNTPGVIDTNDRLARSVTIATNAASELSTSGDFFVLSNGVREVTFEFLEAGQDATIDGAITIEYQPNASLQEVAEATVAAINSVSDFNIDAGLTNGSLFEIALHGDIVIVDNPGDLSGVSVSDEVGDTNREREQGQVIISSNIIRDVADYGIRVEAGARTGTDGDAVPNPGSVINFVESNEGRLAPGATIVNNIVARAGTGGILVSGDNATAIDQDGNPVSVASAPVTVARIINNTIVGATNGAGNGIGINVENNVSPTILNNVLSDLNVGIQVDASSDSSVVGFNLFQQVASIPVPGDEAILLQPADPLFVDPANDNFFPAPQSQAIDSSISSLNDRDDLVSVRDPLGISLSPILAPERDASGQFRVDDPDVEGLGVGADVFVDRGALDRSDFFFGPTATLISPIDNDPDGIDENPANNDVTITENALNPILEFVIQLVDGGGTDISLGGVGVDDFSVISDAVTLFLGEDILVEGFDYTFGYDSTNNQIRLTPASGFFTQGAYRIELTDPIRDLFGNPLTANRPGGSTLFNINIGSATFDFGDAPAPYPTSEADDGARHSLQSDLFLGSLVSTEATPRAFDDDDGVQVLGQFVPGADVSLVVTASRGAQIDGWIDWNQDGDWDDPGEQIFNSTAVSAGANTFEISVPVDAVVGSTFSRFRLSDTGGLAPTGATSGGEVEDYSFDILAQGTDLGDAPAPYPTLLSDGGAIHNIVPGFFLGDGIDGEDDGLPSGAADADGDDGVVFSTSLAIATDATITVTASAAGFLDGWFDWNQDGDWDDVGEQLFSSQSLTAGENILSIEVPNDASLGATFARFRFSSEGGLAPGGSAVDGEVEDYRVSISDAPIDFGDAPDPSYPTLLSSDGARHTIVEGFHLGATITSETDGNETPFASGDSGDDGVEFGSLIPGINSSIAVTVSGQGLLDAWFDFNGDGDWFDAGEQVLTSALVTNGSNQLQVAIPDGLEDGRVHARFRLSTAGGLSPTGRANDGEVEDYFPLIEAGSGWHNEALPEDVNDDGNITPLDALEVINELNNREISNEVSGALPVPSAPPFFDVNNDGFASPIDAILIINALNAASNPAPTAPLSIVAGIATNELKPEIEAANQSIDTAQLHELVFADLDEESERNDSEEDRFELHFVEPAGERHEEYWSNRG